MPELTPSLIPTESEAAALTPRQIVAELDRYIVGQADAKRAVAIAVRNRWRRQQVPDDMKKEIGPKNMLMIGPTGVGKTEIARRLAAMTRAPFIKVEATKYTEVGYYGRDAESMVRDLIENAIGIVREQERIRIKEKAEQAAENRLVDLIAREIPKWEAGNDNAENTDSDSKNEPETEAEKMAQLAKTLIPNLQNGSFSPAIPREVAEQIQNNPSFPLPGFADFVEKLQNSVQEKQGKDSAKNLAEETKTPQKEAPKKERTVDKDEVRRRLRAGEYEETLVPITTEQKMPKMMIGIGGMESMESDFQNLFENILPRKNSRHEIPVSEARKIIVEQESERLIDREKVNEQAITLAENFGIIFIDEIDKIVSSGTQNSADVSRQGVQRDLLPIVEGTTIQTKYGFVSTDHILFIAAGAFHRSSPSDLMPELQGRFPIRVELTALTESDFCRILTEPHGALTKQYQAMMKTEGVELVFEEDAIAAIAKYAHDLNQTSQNIGARRLYTMMERLLEELSFEAPDMKMGRVMVNGAYVAERLDKAASDEDLSKFIL